MKLKVNSDLLELYHVQLRDLWRTDEPRRRQELPLLKTITMNVTRGRYSLLIQSD